MFCLIPQHVDAFTKALRSGDISPEKLSKMTSAERNSFLGKVVGAENAKTVNSLLESKLLLKNQQRGMITWAKQVSGISPVARRDLIAKIERMQNVLDPGEHRQFMADLTATRLGTNVTEAEAKRIADISRKISEAVPNKSTVKQAMLPNFKPTSSDLQYGRAASELRQYVGDLKNKAKTTKLSDFKGTGALTIPARAIAKVTDLSKSLGASLDDSFIGRQGGSAFWTNNRQWQKATANSFTNIAKGLKDARAVEQEVNAQLMAHPLYEKALQDKLSIVGMEDAFPSQLHGLPGIGKVFDKTVGRAFDASEVGYTAMAHQLRFAIYTKELQRMERLGMDVSKSSADTKGIARMVNSLTGSGGLGAFERVAKNINFAFYSLRFLKSNFDKLLLHPLGSGIGGTADKLRGVEGAKVVSYAQKRAATNLVKIISGGAAVLATANALSPGSVETDPTSSDFGKIKIGDTRFDISGGQASILTLAARLFTQTSKSSTTGKVTQLNTGKPNSPTEWTTLIDFFGNKLSPVGGVGRDVLKGQDAQGNKPTIAGEAAKLVTPLSFSNFSELSSNPHSANIFAAMIADGLGISTNTYSASGNKGTVGTAGNTSWDNNQSKKVAAFKATISPEKFNEAGQKFDNQYNSWVDNLKSKSAYKDMSPVNQTALLTQKKAMLESQIMKEYGFKYKRGSKSKKSDLLK